MRNAGDRGRSGASANPQGLSSGAYKERELKRQAESATMRLIRQAANQGNTESGQESRPEPIDRTGQKEQEVSRSGGVRARVAMMIREWRANSGASEDQSEPADQEVTHPAYALASSTDPWAEFGRGFVDHSGTSTCRPRPFLGAVPEGYAFAAQDQSVLALARPRSNKTAGTLFGALATWTGPAISTSNKPDVLYSTAMVRSRIGPIYQFSPDGKPHAPGVIPIRWSPLEESRTWAGAQAQAEAMMGAVSGPAGGRSDDSSFWSKQGESLLAPAMYAAALKRRGHALGRGSCCWMSSARINAAAALKAYTHPGALAQTENPNFDPAEFVAGDPEALNEDRYDETDRGMAPHASLQSIADRLPRGKYGTVYIASDNPLIKPIVAGFLRALIRATFAQHEADEVNRYRHRVKVLWAADEVALTPLHDFLELLGYCASKGLLIVACAQDLSQFARTWGRDAADAVATLFQEIVVFPGIRNTQTLEALSLVLGKRWHRIENVSHGYSTGERLPSKSWNQGENHELLPVLDPAEIAAGNEENPDLALMIRPDGWGWVHPMPYFKTPFWPEALVATMAYIRHLPDGDRRQWLPYPDLDRDGNGRWLRGRPHKPRLYETYCELRDWFDARQQASVPTTPPPPRRPPAVLELSFSAGDSAEDIVRTIQAAYGAWDQTAASKPSPAPTSDNDSTREGE